MGIVWDQVGIVQVGIGTLCEEIFHPIRYHPQHHTNEMNVILAGCALSLTIHLLRSAAATPMLSPAQPS